jgi:tricarballylate dehydrogenase
VLDHDAAKIAGLYAAGEMVGGIFYFNDPSGAGLVSGAVFGRLAGASAASAPRRSVGSGDSTRRHDRP